MSVESLEQIAFTPISTGLQPNDGLGDSPLEAALKINRMLEALFSGSGTVSQIIAGVQAELQQLRDLVAAGGGTGATLLSTLEDSGLSVDHVQGMASRVLALTADFDDLATRFAALEAQL